MKLSKEQKQKLALGGMLVVGVIYAYFEFLLGPLQKAGDAARRAAAALEPKLAQAKAQIAKVAELRKKEPEADHLMAQVKAMTPDASPIAWFPPRITEFFKKQGVERVTTRLNNETPDPELTGFRRLSWGIETPKVEFVPFAAAVSALENEEPLVEVQSFEAEAGREDVGSQRAALVIHNIISL